MHKHPQLSITTNFHSTLKQIIKTQQSRNNFYSVTPKTQQNLNDSQIVPMITQMKLKFRPIKPKPSLSQASISSKNKPNRLARSNSKKNSKSPVKHLPKINQISTTATLLKKEIKNDQQKNTDNTSTRHKFAVSVIEKNPYRKKQYITQLMKSKGNTVASIKSKIKQLQPIVDPKQQLEQFKIIRDQYKSILNSSNKLHIKNQSCHFRIYVEKGNNGLLIKQLIKKRWWWHIQDDKFKANLIWTEWFNRDVVQKLDPAKSQDVINQQTSFGCIIDQLPQGDQKKKLIKKLLSHDFYNQIQTRITSKHSNYFKSSLTQGNIFTDNYNTKEINISQKKIIQAHNHVEGCLHLHSKKLLFRNFVNYCSKLSLNPFSYMPLTFYIDKVEGQAYQSFLLKFQQYQREKNIQNIWICKPGQNSNRGYGIKIFKQKQQLLNHIHQHSGKSKSYRKGIIVQKYLQNCFLIQKRKFDIRCYILITTVNGHMKGYWYEQAYIRTSSQEYKLNDPTNVMVHLTNDAIQKNNKNYGKFESNNKISLAQFKNYLEKQRFSPSKFDNCYKQMKNISSMLIQSVKSHIKRNDYTFELFGLDFMLDSQLTPYLIEANSNPCLDTSGMLLDKLIRQLVQNVIMTAIDPIFPPPSNGKGKQYINKDYFAANKFELIYHD